MANITLVDSFYDPDWAGKLVLYSDGSVWQCTAECQIQIRMDASQFHLRKAKLKGESNG